MNMNKWCQEVFDNKNKRALPIITFPAITKMNVSVKELINHTGLQVQALNIIKQECDPLAILGFMDLSVEAECFKATIKVSDNDVPTVVGQLISNEDEAKALEVPKVGSGRTSIYLEAIKQCKKDNPDIPVLGGCIGPFSLAGRLMDVSEAMINCYEEPEMVHTVLQKATEFLTNYIMAYKEIGADGILMAEPLAGILSPALATKFSSNYVKEIVAKLQDENFIIIYHNCGNNTLKMIDDFIDIDAKAYHFGNAIEITEMLKKMPRDKLIMGNLDPVDIICNGDVTKVEQATKNLLNKCQAYPNFIISSGCDIPPLAPWENIKAFMNTSKKYYEDNS